MANTLDDLPLVDPQHLLQECLDRDLPTDWHGRATVARFRPGREPGSATVLMARGDVEALDPYTDHTLFLDDLDGGSIELKRMTLRHSESVVSGPAGDALAIHIVELVDRRHHFQRTPFSRGYNITTDGTSYRADSKNDGALWAWQEMLDDLWYRLPAAGKPPVLPFSPHGTPTNFAFYGHSSAWSAYNDVLDRLACVVVLDPKTDSFSIVRMGEADSKTESLERSAQASSTMWDSDPLRFDRADRPEKLVITFQRFPQPSDGGDPTYSITKTLAAAKGVQVGTAIQLQDDAPAIGSYGDPLNVSYLTARAEERATDFLRKLKGFDRRLNRSYLGIWPDAGRAQGKTYAGVAWQDRGAGFRTELMAEPKTMGFDWKGMGFGGLMASTTRNSSVLGICAETVNDAYGNPVTTIKQIVRRLDLARVCLPLKNCCPAEYYCVYNRLLSTDVSPCSGSSTPVANRFTATSVMRVRFADKTGFATDPECGLPDGIFLYSDDGLTWTGGGTFTMGGTTFTGGVTVACVEGVLKVTWGVSGFTGTTPVTIPDELTSTETDLGTFTVDLKRCKPCDPTVDAPPSTVRIYISSTLDEDEEPESPLKVEAGWVPPWFFNGGPFETLEDAEQCCPFGFLEPSECWEVGGVPDPLDPPLFISGNTAPPWVPMGFNLPKRINLYFHSGTGTLAGANGVTTWETNALTAPGFTVLTGGDVGYFARGVGFNSQACLDSPNSFTVPGTSVQLKCAILMMSCFDGRNLASAPDPMTNFFSRIIVAMKMYSPNEIYRHANTVAEGGSFGPDATPFEGSSALRLKPGSEVKKYTIVISGGRYIGPGTLPGTCLVDFYL